ncbi:MULTISPECIES: tol-pal system YbgF family protein [unclassified Fibrobacter]|uniref:tetratricopeptide repeat protein n=1 Tax=unclassified Fibrobacter TaxID=2634177 RepID=UPI000D6ACEC3|nr:MULTISPECIES: hypothetical protein [unclassified Fibrobacter]PWJ68543.1 hypothetical protein BGX12_10769 [Fibrobacter sp. UWR4]PZW72065.1 hypothetical protein C8E88_100837 [Fibrobacter sp. UWR1]
MKARLIALAASVFCVSLTGCNGVGPKETLIAKINDDSVYKEDVLYMLDGGRYDHDSLPLGKMLYDRFYSGYLIAEKALAEYPGLEKEWKELSEALEIRWLTTVYRDYYLGECMGFADAELRKYYESNRENYPNADSITGFYGVRNDVARDYYVLKNKDDFEAFLKKELKLNKEPSAKDTAEAKRRYSLVRAKEMKESIAANILENEHYKIVELPPIDPKAYYEKYKDQYKTVPGYELYDLQGSDSVALTKVLPENADLQTFKSVAVKNSANKLIAADSGYVGVVKQNYAIPYGIGMMNELDPILVGKSAGFITPALRSADGNFHRFYLAATVPSEVKPYERVAPAILKSIENRELLDVDSSVVLITKDGKPVFTEADLIRFNEQFVKRPLTKRSHDWTVNMLAEHYAFSDAARRLKLDHEWEYRAIFRSARLEFLTERYMDSVVVNVSEDSARIWFDKNLAAANPLTKFDEVKYRMMAMASFPQVLSLRDYYRGYAVMYRGQSFNKVLLNLFDRHFGEYRSAMKNRLAAEAYNNARIHLYDSSIPEYKPTSYLQALLSRADSLNKAGNKDDAYLEYRSLLFAYGSVDSLASMAMYEMADLRNDQGRFDEADADYYAFYKIFPQHPNAEKAMFSRGFILNENMGKDSLALEVLTEFVNRYPNSEFKESANWLIDNIRSGGKLQEELSKKIEETP